MAHCSGISIDARIFRAVLPEITQGKKRYTRVKSEKVGRKKKKIRFSTHCFLSRVKWKKMEKNYTIP